MRLLRSVLGFLLLTGCGLPVNEDPEFLSPDDAGLDPDELVIGFESGGVARAYPIKAMAPLEILNDRIGDRSIAITWCPLSATAAVFDRGSGGMVHTFRFHPDLYKFNLIIEDLETGTQWSQLAMQAIEGERKGARLDLLPSLQTSWKRWYEAHPNTVVMRPSWGGHAFRYRPPGEPGPDGLAPKALVYVARLNGDTRAYPVNELGGVGVALADEVGGRNVRVQHVREGPTVWVELEDGTPVPGVVLYREYLPEFFPSARLWRAASEEERMVDREPAR